MNRALSVWQKYDERLWPCYVTHNRIKVLYGAMIMCAFTRKSYLEVNVTCIAFHSWAAERVVHNSRTSPLISRPPFFLHSTSPPGSWTSQKCPLAYPVSFLWWSNELLYFYVLFCGTIYAMLRAPSWSQNLNLCPLPAPLYSQTKSWNLSPRLLVLTMDSKIILFLKT